MCCHRHDGLRSVRGPAAALGLKRDGQFADLVQEQRATAGTFEESWTGGDSSGEGATFVAEEFGLQQGRSNGGTIKDDEGLRCSWASLVQRLGEAFFSCTGLAFDDDRHISSCQACAQGVEALHLETGAEHVSEATVSRQHDFAQRRSGLDLKGGGAHDDLLAAMQQSIANGDAVDDGAVGGAQVGEGEAIEFDFEGGVSKRNGPVSQLEVAGEPSANQKALRQGRVYPELTPFIRAFHDSKDERAGRNPTSRICFQNKGAVVGVVLKALRHGGASYRRKVGSQLQASEMKGRTLHMRDSSNVRFE